jgi:hypothetical protein
MEIINHNLFGEEWISIIKISCAAVNLSKIAQRRGTHATAYLPHWSSAMHHGGVSQMTSPLISSSQIGITRFGV